MGNIRRKDGRTERPFKMTYTDNHPKFNCPCGLTEKIEQAIERLKDITRSNLKMDITQSQFIDAKIEELKDLLD